MPEPTGGLSRRRAMGTAKYDHPGYIADIGPQGRYYVGVWCPHGYPAHVHIGNAGVTQAAAGLRLRIPDGAFQSLSDDFETLCRRAIGQAVPSGLLRDGLGGSQETRPASSDERRVGKEGVTTWSSRWSAYHEKKKRQKE